MLEEIRTIWPVAIGLGTALAGIVLLLGLEIRASRGVAREEEITRHRLLEHHGFDPDRGRYNLPVPEEPSATDSPEPAARPSCASSRR